MKKYILSLAGVVLFVMAFTACSNNAPGKAATNPSATDSSAATTTAKDTTIKATAVVYTCRMHPEVISDKPGKCPKCGMDLVKKEDLKKDSTIH